MAKTDVDIFIFKDGVIFTFLNGRDHAEAIQLMCYHKTLLVNIHVVSN